MIDPFIEESSSNDCEASPGDRPRERDAGADPGRAGAVWTARSRACERDAVDEMMD